MKEKIIDNHYTYWQVFFYIGAVWGYIQGFLNGIDNIAYAWLEDNLLGAIFSLVFLNFFAMVNAVISGLLMALVWGGLLFIPYLVVRKLL